MILESYPAIVMANDARTDPNKEFGVSVIIPLLMHDIVWPELAKPIFPPNMAKAPAVGQQIEVVVVADAPGTDYEDEMEMGTVNYAHHCFYTGRMFDSDKGKIPAVLQQDYPSRAGWWLEDGTIIWMSQKKNAPEIYISVGNGQTFIQLVKDEILLTQGSTSLSLKNGVVTTTCTSSKMGSSSASQALVLATMTTAMTTLFGTWSAAATALKTGGGTPAAVITYAGALETAIAAVQGTLSSWNSSKHKADQ